LKHIIFATLIASACATVCAQVAVKDAWVRATVSPQKATGAFMQLTATRPARLVAVRTPLATSAELHTMSVENDVMRMRQVDGIDLPAGVPVALKPGAFHLMLLGLHKPLGAGQRVPITLVFEAADKRRFSVDVDAPVRPLASGPGSHASPQIQTH
jgi:copper(I)-binding protein